ncbi:hypothetical protein VP01_3733g3 [Puccinia sorghi]|uniref:Uncharacterized protein n=1 Tax=Puccinia sorghi TaxID=27349 RepID=A0A0L6UTY8_9BASI|nr:hypothetical protein VP01_3733g3 [Puccinia sorghi]
MISLWLLQQAIPWNQVEDSKVGCHFGTQVVFGVTRCNAQLIESNKFNLIHNVWMTKGNRGLIAGYGILWNIEYQSRECAYEAREVSIESSFI